jgi:N-acetylmuramoyl-L-alanine amidase
MVATDYADLSDLELLEICVFREARGEPIDGKRAVAHVVRNRVYSGITWWGEDWHSVILHRFQFSSFDLEDPNADVWPSETDPAWIECCQAAEPVFNGTDPDLTQGALWYKVSTLPWPASWGDPSKYSFTIEIGRQSFYRRAEQPQQVLSVDQSTDE